MTATIENIKDKFTELVGEKIIITVEAGRRKTTTHKGTLAETYPAVFIVELDNYEDSYERVSYSYADVLTNAIEVNFPDRTPVSAAEDEDIEG
ncbi:Uncharacterized protein Veg [Atopostipes suicloacalis DSM 15692]|uniref:Uncharacterized protein Veg n=1 Tax=Atopostipes suicloacalis DSM 15692 TaxID=1121025 RepID=A0A1M4V3L0_9LACT|nr:Veg family protein [Atopostipes suicloacalis]SHE63571.1 Uncharacterized protein Veg [Atopostipes suicloacalis DSM 15692]